MCIDDDIVKLENQFLQNLKQKEEKETSKEGKDMRHLSNWRHISFLNVDMKIAASVIGSRMHYLLK